MNQIIKASFIKASLLSCISLCGISLSGIALQVYAGTEQSKEAPALSKTQLDQTDTYILYALAVRDANTSPNDSTMSVSKKGNVTTYTFKEHVIKECGSHLNGTVQVTENTQDKLIAAKFPTVTKNPLGIKSFSLDITESKKIKGDIKGIGMVNGSQFDAQELMTIPGYHEAIASLNN